MQIFQSIALDGIQATIALRVYGDQSRGLKHLEVLRHSRSTHWPAFRQLAHGLGLLAQRFEDAAAGWVGEGGEHFCVSHYLR